MSDISTKNQAGTLPGAAIKLPAPQAEPHPLRFGIFGVTDTIANLKSFVAAQTYSEAMKAFIGAELDQIKENAACIHLHDVLRPDGGFDLHLSISAVHLGGKAGSVATGAQLGGRTS